MGTWQLLAPDWDALTDAEKIALFEGTDYSVPTGAELMALGAPFKVAIYDVVSSGQSMKINGIPKTQTVLPTQLISTASFDRVDKIDFVYSETGSGSIKVAATTDLSTYKVFNSSTGNWDTIAVADIPTGGMSLLTVNTLTSTSWQNLGIRNGIAFAFVLDITNSSDRAEVDKMSFEGESKPYWRSQVHGIVYDYDYISSNMIRVKIYEDGDYKINYKKKN